MIFRSARLPVLLGTFVLSAIPAAQAADTPAGSATAPRWYKGNTHSHTMNSDGDSPAAVVAAWYRDNGYDFLVLSDHIYLTPTAELQQEIDRATQRKKLSPFLLIPGEEVDSDIHDLGLTERRTIHFTAVGIDRVVPRPAAESFAAQTQKTIDDIRAAGGLPILNHPNYYWSYSVADFLAAKHVRHFELHSGHPTVHSQGGGGRPSTEEMWDEVLTSGRIYYAVAADDAHEFRQWTRVRSNPGRAWVMVRARELTPQAIVDALWNGDFYASNGVELEDVTTDDQTLRVQIKQQWDARGDPRRQRNIYRYRTYFIGSGGRVLKVDDSMEPSYRLQPGDRYVRARIVSSAGEMAWTQPLFAPGQGRHE